ncbi:MAG: hypothetical protein AAFU79_27250 [Myxococcota bacterium]
MIVLHPAKASPACHLGMSRPERHDFMSVFDIEADWRATCEGRPETP